jgi:hypothetical protein
LLYQSAIGGILIDSDDRQYQSTLRIVILVLISGRSWVGYTSLSEWRWRQVLRTLEHFSEVLVTKSPEAKPVIDLLPMLPPPTLRCVSPPQGFMVTGKAGSLSWKRQMKL